MKTLFRIASFLLASVAFAQTPDCISYFQFTGTGSTSYLDNRQKGCTNWTVVYASSGFSAISLVFQSATGAVTPGTFGNYGGTTVTGANPATNTTALESTFTGYEPWVRMRLNSVTGTGTVTGVLYGYKTGYASGGGSTMAQVHSITFQLDGGGAVLTPGDVNVFIPVAYACTIDRYDVTGYPSGSLEVDIWKAAGSIPTSMNLISSTSPVELSMSQLNQNGDRTGWTNTVASGDVFGAEIVAATTVERATIIIWCQ